MTKSPPPDLKTYMIAIGEQHQKMAALTAPRVEKCAGVEVELITEGEPFEMKMNLLERTDSPVFYVDADAVMLDWDWTPFEWSSFNACLDSILNPAFAPYDDLKTLFNPDTSINTGVFLATSEHRELFARARDLKVELKKKKFPYLLGDQTAVNLAISQSTGLRLNVLPQGYNWPVWMDVPYRERLPAGTYLVHLLGGSTHDSTPGSDTLGKYERVAKMCQRFPLAS